MELTGDIWCTAAGIIMQHCDDYRMQVVQYSGGTNPTGSGCV